MGLRRQAFLFGNNLSDQFNVVKATGHPRRDSDVLKWAQLRSLILLAAVYWNLPQSKVCRRGERGVQKSIFLFLTKKDRRSKICDRMEVLDGFEPSHEGFADPCLTTWLQHHMERLTRLELATSTWQGGALPDELKPHFEMAQLRSLVYYTKLKGVCQEKIFLFFVF